MTGIDLSKLASIQKLSKKSYNDQKALIKKVLAGREMPCEHCGNLLVFIPADDQQSARIQCIKRTQVQCIDIELDVSN